MPESDQSAETTTAYAANQAWWNEITEPHSASGMYDMAAFKAGRNRFMHQYILDEVGDVDGKSLLHLQCHFGQDTISLARLGAREAVGVDFSPTALAEARRLAEQTGTAKIFRFVEADVLDLDLGERFDVVFTSQGTIV